MSAKNSSRWWKTKWLLFFLSIAVFHFLTGFPQSELAPRYLKVEAAVEHGGVALGLSPSSWATIGANINTKEVAWAQENGIALVALQGAKKAASLERGGLLGKPATGTGLKVSMFDLLAQMSIESSAKIIPESGLIEDPTKTNVTGGHRAWTQLVKHRLLNGPKEVLALRKICGAIGVDWKNVLGSVSGAIGWTQSLPTNWERYMGVGFSPWFTEHALEFDARFLTDHGYFTEGRRHAFHRYNPRNDEYPQAVIDLADELERSYKASINQPEVTVSIEDGLEAAVSVQAEPPTQLHTVSLGTWPLESVRTGVPFGAWSYYQPSGHTGVDFRATNGTRLRAVGDGVVVFNGWFPQVTSYRVRNVGHGNTCWILHGFTQSGEPVYSVYAHLSKFLKEVGQTVKEGEIIALSGSTGAGEMPHFHFAIRVGGGFQHNGTDAQGRRWQDGRWVNPDDWIDTNITVSSEVFVGPKQYTSITSEQYILTLVETPAVKEALKTAKMYKNLKQATDWLGKLDRIPPIDWLYRGLVRIEGFARLAQRIISTLAIAGQESGQAPIAPSWLILGLE